MSDQEETIQKAKEIVEDFVEKLTEKRGENYANFFTFVLNQRTLLEAMSDMAMLAAEKGKQTEELTDMWDFISTAASTMSSQFATGLKLSEESAQEAFQMANEMYKKIHDNAGNTTQ